MAAIDDGPWLPPELQYLWDWFNELMMAVAPGGFSASAATWGNIADWATLMRVAIEPWEARLLACLSVSRANVLADTAKASPTPAHPPVGKRKKR